MLIVLLDSSTKKFDRICLDFRIMKDFEDKRFPEVVHVADEGRWEEDIVKWHGARLQVVGNG